MKKTFDKIIITVILQLYCGVGLVMEIFEYNILASKIGYFKTKIESINKKAKNIGCDPITYVVGDIIGDDKQPPRVKIQLHATTIKINGWKFIGCMEHKAEGKNIIKCIPGESIPEKYRTAKSVCDHCGVNRYRRNTYILRSSNNDYQQIGKSCLKDFMGHDPRQVAEYAEIISSMLDDLNDGDDVKDSSEYTFVLTRFLKACAIMVRQHGWTSVKKAKNEGGFSTASRAVEAYFSDLQSTDADETLVEKSLQWVNQLSYKQMSDWEHNLVIMASEPYIYRQDCNFAASIIGGYLASINNVSDNSSNFVGNIGDKLSETLTVITAKPLKFGILYQFTDKQNNRYTWFASKMQKITSHQRDRYIVVGDTVSISGKIKDHQEFNGVKSTHITCCKIQ